MLLEISLAIFAGIAIYLSIKVLIKYGVEEKYNFLQIGIALMSCCFSKESNSIIWGGGAVFIFLINIFFDQDQLKMLLKNKLINFIVITFSNLLFIIDNIHDIIIGTRVLIIITGIISSITIIIITLIYICYGLNYIIHRYKL